MTLIALSGKRRSGKTTVGNILRDEYGYSPMSLALPLKDLCQAHFGLTLEQTDGTFKEAPTQYGFLTPRQIMIHMGQAYRYVDPDYWVKDLFRQLDDDSAAYVITDVRFLNEVKHLVSRGALTVRLERDEKYTGKAINDPSETELDNYDKWDLVIPAHENKTMADLHLVAQRINRLVLSRA